MTFMKCNIEFTSQFTLEEAESLKDKFFEFMQEYQFEQGLDIEYDFSICDVTD